MPIVDLLHHHDNLRPLVSRCADVNAIDLLLSACCEVFPRYEALKNKYEKNKKYLNLRMLYFLITLNYDKYFDKEKDRLNNKLYWLQREHNINVESIH